MFDEDNVNENAVEATEPEYLSPHQLARKLNVSQKSITNWTQNRRLPAVKMGRVWRYPRLEIEKRLLNGRLLTEKNIHGIEGRKALYSRRVLPMFMEETL